MKKSELIEIIKEALKENSLEEPWSKVKKQKRKIKEDQDEKEEFDMPFDLFMVIFSHLSDLQEEYPKAAQKINFIKVLIKKLKEGVTTIPAEELNSTYSKHVR